MLRVLGLDTETTGLSMDHDRITEIGLVLWEVETKKPLLLESILISDGQKISPENEALTGISEAMLKEFGIPVRHALNRVEEICTKYGVEAFVAHNATGFDKPMLLTEMRRHEIEHPRTANLQWLDTKTDLPIPFKQDSTKLKYLASDHGFLNPFQHRALTDALTMMRLFSEYNIKDILSEANAKRVIVRAMIPAPWHDSGVGKDKAKAAGYRWEEVDTFRFDKAWVKKIKKDEYNKEQQLMAGYEVLTVLEL